MSVYTVTMTCYPGLILNLNWGNLPPAFLPTIVIGCFNTCDTIGRAVPSFFKAPDDARIMRGLSALRLLWILVISLGMPNMGITYLQDSIWFSVLNMVLLGTTNGLIGTYVMISGCRNKNPEVAGYIMAFSLTMGLAVGSSLAILLGIYLT
jgi:hypothetical protein